MNCFWFERVSPDLSPYPNHITPESFVSHLGYSGTPFFQELDVEYCMALTQIDRVDQNERMAECIDNCFEAAQAAEWCADECIQLGSDEMVNCIRLCRDVADLATLHARFMVRNSDYHGDLAAICADLCQECATECEHHDHDHCQTTATILRDCADSCRDMAAT